MWDNSVGDGRRFIPTCVGNIAGIMYLGIGIPVHPHVCGEHQRRGAGFIAGAGSSPRVWGT